MDIIKTKELTIGKIAEVIDAVLPETVDSSAKVNRVLTQSAYVVPGDVVISAGWYSKVNIVKDSLTKGAIAVFCDKETKNQFAQNNVIAIDDPLGAVTKFETWRAEGCNAVRIAITGSVGKTTTTGLINSVIANSFNTLTHHSMANSHGAILRNVQDQRVLDADNIGIPNDNSMRSCMHGASLQKE